MPYQANCRWTAVSKRSPSAPVPLQEASPNGPTIPWHPLKQFSAWAHSRVLLRLVHQFSLIHFQDYFTPCELVTALCPYDWAEPQSPWHTFRFKQIRLWLHFVWAVILLNVLYLPKLYAMHTWYEILPYVKVIMHPMRQFCLGSVTETTKESCQSGFISSVPMENTLCRHFRPPQCAPPDSWDCLSWAGVVVIFF